MEVELRIRNAFLSEKNAESVYDQIVSEAEAKCGVITRCYDHATLRAFQVSMMRYLWAMCSPQLQKEHLGNPKKTVFLLNALTLRRVVKAVCMKIKERTTVPPALTSFPTLPSDAYASYPDNVVGSISIGCLASKRKTVRIAKLDKDPGPLHLFWRRPDQRHLLEERYAQEIGFPLPETKRTTDETAATFVDVCSTLPWKYVTISSENRTFGSTEAYTISPEGLTNMYRLCLFKVDIPLAVPLLSDTKSIFYFSEDDEPMHAIDLTSAAISERISNRSQPMIVALQDEMNDLGRHAYSITKDKFTHKITITQITRTSGVKGRFSLLFEQTKDNCADVLGYKKENYHGKTSYEGSEPCRESLYVAHEPSQDTASPTGTISVRIPQMSDQPIIQLTAIPGSDGRKLHDFDDYVLYENCNIRSPGLSLPALSVAFSNEDNTEPAVIGEHHFVFKCWYARDEESGTRDRVDMPDNASVTDSETSGLTHYKEAQSQQHVDPDSKHDVARDMASTDGGTDGGTLAKPRRKKLPPLSLPQ